MTDLAASVAADSVTPGLLGFLVVAGMGLALYFLFRSLNKQLNKIAPNAPARPAKPPRPGLAAFRASQNAAAGGAEASTSEDAGTTSDDASGPDAPGQPDRPDQSGRPDQP